jgi:hypothetical protein
VTALQKPANDIRRSAAAHMAQSAPQQNGQQKDSPVQTGQELEMVRGTGFKPADSTLQQQPLSGQGTQGGTQNCVDPILARLVDAWPDLSDERKKIFGSLLETV